MLPAGRGTTREFARDLIQPAQFGAELLNRQANHPDCLMEAMANFFSNPA
jgi:hypothetical protein